MRSYKISKKDIRSYFISDGLDEKEIDTFLSLFNEGFSTDLFVNDTVEICALVSFLG